MQNTLLIVDDESTNLAALRAALGSDYNLVFARGGQDALLAARKHQPGLILLDVQMPDMDGYEVCRQLKADPATEAAAVIFVTSRNTKQDETTGFEVGGVDYLVKPVVPEVVQARVRNHLSLIRTQALEKSHREALQMLSHAGRFNDSETGNHIWRMAAYARTLAEVIGWPAERCDLLEQAAPLHDIGKVGVPQAILLKPGGLTTQERAIMKTHTTIGHNILSTSDAPVFAMAAEIAWCHHERWDGEGYPRGLSGADIPESARIVALADVFDALSLRRSYKESWSVEKIVEHITASGGSQFDPRLTRCFIDSLPQLMALRAKWADNRLAPESDSVLRSTGAPAHA